MEFLTERRTQVATGFIETNRAHPFYLNRAHYTVQFPLGVRDVDIARLRGKAGNYDPVHVSMLDSLDEPVGQVLGAIDRSAAASRTMVVFFSGNVGRFEGQRNREPLIVRFPGRVKPGTTIDTPVDCVGFLPAFCDLACRWAKSTALGCCRCSRAGSADPNWPGWTLAGEEKPAPPVAGKKQTPRSVHQGGAVARLDSQVFHFSLRQRRSPISGLLFHFQLPFAL